MQYRCKTLSRRLGLAAAGIALAGMMSGCGKSGGGFLDRDDVYKVQTVTVYNLENPDGNPYGCVLELGLETKAGKKGGKKRKMCFEDCVKDVRSAANRITSYDANSNYYIKIDNDYQQLDNGLYDGVEGIRVVVATTKKVPVERVRERTFNPSKRGYFDRNGKHITVK